jgi:hypothetical protein
VGGGLRRKARPALRPPILQDRSARARLHARAEPVLALTPTSVRLEGSLGHLIPSLSCGPESLARMVAKYSGLPNAGAV